MGLFLELLLTALVVLGFSFLIAKLVSFAVPNTSEEKNNLDQKIVGAAEEVKSVDKGLKVKRLKSKKKRVKFVDVDAASASVVGKVVHLESSEKKPIKDFDGSEDMSEKVGILERSLESDCGFEGGKVDQESEALMTHGEELVEKCVNMARAVKGDDMERKKGSKDVEEKKKEAAVLAGEMKTEGLAKENESELMNDENAQDNNIEGRKVSKDVDLFDEAFDREAVWEKDEHVKFGELRGVKDENAVDSCLGGLVVGKEMETESIDVEEVKLMNDESHQNNAAAGEMLASNGEFMNKELEREAVEVGLEDTAIDADKVYESNIEMVRGNLDDLAVEMKIEGEVKLAYDDDISAPRNEEGRDMSTKEDNAVGTGEDIPRNEEVGYSAASDDDDDWEGIERSELDKVFAEAVNYVECGAKTKDEKLGSDVLRQLYALHRLALEGPCHEPQPMALKVSARAKWNAWQKLGSMSPEVAMEEYIKILSDNDPGWMQHSSAEDEQDGSSKTETGIYGSPDTESNPAQDPQTIFEVGTTKHEKVD